ncbi:GDSL-type esterase/lipase family protein [Streptomyces olivaceoviridis]
MPLGDSITAGWGSVTWSGYREELFDHLHRLGHDIDFDGPCHAATQLEGDPDHAGWSGITIEGVTANAPTFLPTVAPDWILLHIGTNNVYDDVSAAAAPDHLCTLLETTHRL